jgi:TetR/AcrR family transcriptional regulator, mexJK operon transcriptional repressor
MATVVNFERRAGRPIDETKRAAVLDAAQRLFLRNGFAGTSMDAVAESAGVSKLTAYKYFGSKQELFAQSVAAKCESAFAPLDIDHLAGHDVRSCLVSFGRTFLSLILDPEAMAVHHLIVAERERAPELGRLFFENAVRPIADKLATLIARHEEAGRIDTGDDPVIAAMDLLALWRGRPFMMRELGAEGLDDASLALHVDHVVDLCLRAWSPR